MGLQSGEIAVADAAYNQPKKKRKKGGGAPSGAAPRLLNLADLFKKVKTEGEEKANRPVLVEICSGDGEWICAQALRNQEVAWVACELRLDRAGRCFQRFALQGLSTRKSNLGLIAGDAEDALKSRLASSSVSHLFVNFPEPPHQTDMQNAVAQAKSDKEAPATHLLTSHFLADACGAVLRPGGTLTVCTDSEEYAMLVLGIVASAKVTKVFEDALRGTKAEKKGFVDAKNKMALRDQAPPPKVCGADYSHEASESYFQRLKRSEQSSRGRNERSFFICLKRRDEKAAEE